MANKKKKRLSNSRLASGRKVRQPPASQPKFIFYLFLTVALVSLSLCGLTAYRTYQAVSQERSAPGRVVDLVSERHSQESIYFYPLVEYERPGQGRVTVKIPEGSWPPAYRKGDAVTVLYNPQDPDRVRIQSTESDVVQWTLSIISGTLGGAFLIASLVTLWILNQPLPEDKDEMDFDIEE
jgi:hypothetical protein